MDSAIKDKKKKALNGHKMIENRAKNIINCIFVRNYNIHMQITDKEDEIFYTQTDSVLTNLIFTGEKKEDHTGRA